MAGAVDGIDLRGIGMTSQRTRERLIQRLVDQGIADTAVLNVMRITPRHLFLDEAMAAHQDRPACGSGLLQAAGEPALYPGDVLAQGKKAFLRRGGGRHDDALSRFVLVTFS